MSINSYSRFLLGLTGLILSVVSPANGQTGDASSDEAVRTAMKRAATYYFETVASHGGYVYSYAADFSKRFGEGVATPDQIWVQPPGTPTVGMAYLAAWRATDDEYYLRAATAAAEALVAGQLESGAWTNCIDFHPQGEKVARYRNRPGRGRNTSSLDDDQTPAALRFLVLADEAHSLKHTKIHEAATTALEALLAHQYPNGAFPQVWEGPLSVPQVPATQRANLPAYDWRTEGRVKNYWDMYTLNDNVPGHVVRILIEAYRVYGDPRCRAAVAKLGDFLMLAQLPEPQPGWAQQYNYDMQPIWARKFEPAAVSGDETQETIETLMTIAEFTGDAKYLGPIPRGLDYLRRSVLDDNRIPRFLELKTNRPLYMERQGEVYTLTYDDSRLPSHYGWKVDSRIDALQDRYDRLRAGGKGTEPLQPDAGQVRAILAALDDQGRWLSTYAGETLVGQAKYGQGDNYLSSELFAANLERLAIFLKEQGASDSKR